MKRSYLLFALVVISMLFYACQSSVQDNAQKEKEEQMEGKWYCVSSSHNIEDGVETEIIEECTQYYNSDKTTTCSGTITVIYTYNEPYLDKAKFIVDIDYAGSWKIKDDYLVENIDEVNILMTKVTTTPYSRAISDELEENFKDNIPIMKSEILGENKLKIIKFSSDEVLLENEEGSNISCKRIK